MSEIDKLIDISVFADFIKPFAHDVAENVIELYIKEGVVWFCRESRILRDYYIIKCQKNVIDYPIILPKNRELISIESIDPYGRAYSNIQTQHNGRADIFPNAYYQNDVHYRRGGPLDGYGSKYYRLEKDGIYPVIILETAFSNTYEIEIVYSWTVKRDACEFPKIIYEEWAEIIKSYVLNLICLMSDKISDMQKAQYWQNKRDNLLNDALYRIAKRYMNNNGKFRTSPFVNYSMTRRNRWY